VLRPARPDEAQALSDLALRSKAHWGYDQAFLDRCRDELTFDAGEIVARRIVAAEVAGRLIGFYSLDGEVPDGELGNLWVEPDSIGTGFGRQLWQHAIDSAGTVGFTSLLIDADPNAEGFYLAMGARRIGETRSGSIPGRTLPTLQYDLCQRGVVGAEV
jgi:GNAT superfamily N-acetyltransferase